MAKKSKKITGIGLNGEVFVQRSIAIDNMGIPWLIDPEHGTIAPISPSIEPAKQSAVKKRK